MKYSKFTIPVVLIVITAIIFTSCATIPDRAEAVSPFKKEKYLGKWYEIAGVVYKFISPEKTA